MEVDCTTFANVHKHWAWENASARIRGAHGWCLKASILTTLSGRRLTLLGSCQANTGGTLVPVCAITQRSGQMCLRPTPR